MSYTTDKVFSRPFHGILKASKLLKIHVGKTNKKCSCLSDYRSGWSKEPQCKKNCGSFL
jgi:hypothetical protein